MNTKNSTQLSADFINPFLGRNPEEVWKELKDKSTPINKSTLMERLKELQVKKGK